MDDHLDVEGLDRESWFHFFLSFLQLVHVLHTAADLVDQSYYGLRDQFSDEAVDLAFRQVF